MRPTIGFSEETGRFLMRPALPLLEDLLHTVHLTSLKANLDSMGMGWGLRQDVL